MLPSALWCCLLQFDDGLDVEMEFKTRHSRATPPAKVIKQGTGHLSVSDLSVLGPNLWSIGPPRPGALAKQRKPLDLNAILVNDREDYQLQADYAKKHGTEVLGEFITRQDCFGGPPLSKPAVSICSVCYSIAAKYKCKCGLQRCCSLECMKRHRRDICVLNKQR